MSAHCSDAENCDGHLAGASINQSELTLMPVPKSSTLKNKFLSEFIKHARAVSRDPTPVDLIFNGGNGFISAYIVMTNARHFIRREQSPYDGKIMSQRAIAHKRFEPNQGIIQVAR